MKRKLLSTWIVFSMIFVVICSSVACGNETAAPASDEVKADVPAVEEETSWSIYWYLCGSDLETEDGWATEDLQEMMEVSLPENVKVIIQTGGAKAWQNNTMDASKIQRWLYDSDGLFLIDEQPSANMGDPQTLADFLFYASENYPADHTVVTFWNHGGGSVGGVAYDELYDFDSLELFELREAFDTVWGADRENPALELVGFDTCLMATVDVADIFRNFAHYMVASEEIEPSNGWLYSGWLEALAENPSIDGAELGREICDTYYEGCEAEGTQEMVTLSLVDLSKADALLDAYETFGQEALLAATDDPSFFAQFGRAASESENYGGNTREQGYSNLVDLGHLARKTENFLSSACSVMDALGECVLYKVGGIYRSEATGLSCYYSYNGDLDDFNSYTEVGASSAFKSLYSYELTGELFEGGETYLETGELPEVMTLAQMNWDDAPLKGDDDGFAILELGPQADSILSGIDFQLYQIDEENDTMLLLGTDNDITSDWENGVFYDNFRGMWGSIDDHLVYMELSFEGDDYNLYSVPILLNGEDYNLQVSYDFTKEEWSIIGAYQELSASGMAGKELRLLKVGDEITTIWKLASYFGDDDFEEYEVDKIIVTEETAFGETSLPDGSYMMIFEMWDAMGNYAYSQCAIFDCIYGEIYTTVYEE